MAAFLALPFSACFRTASEPGDIQGGNDTVPLPGPVPNRPPVFEPAQPPVWIIPGVDYLLTLRAADPDGDTLAFAGSYPPNASLTGRELRWIPTAEQAGRQSFRFSVTDGHGHSDSMGFAIEVIGFDPWPYTADPRKGRVWRIRGYASTSEGDSVAAADSVSLNRKITLTASLRENSSFTFRVSDTLGGTAAGVRDTSYSVTFLEGAEFRVANLSGLIPFAWPANAGRAESLQVAIGDSDFAARKEIDAVPCPAGGAEPEKACGRTERIFAAGWGMVSYRSERREADGMTRREAYEVWGVSGP